MVDAMHAERMNYFQYNSFFSKTHSLLYVATPKAACTTLKWWFADLVGLRGRMEEATGSRESTAELAVHGLFTRVGGEHTGLPVARLEEIASDPRIFRFCVVRNPFTRAYSAWQSKWLLHESLQVKPYLHAPFMQRTPTTAAGYAAALEEFLEYIFANEHPAIVDIHIKTQRELLYAEALDYSVVGVLENPTGFLSRIASHLGAAFTDPFRGPRANQNLIPYHPRFVSPRSADLIRSLYAADFEAFEYAATPPAAAGDIDDAGVEAVLRAVPAIQARNERIGGLLEEFTTSMDRLRGEIKSARLERDRALRVQADLQRRIDLAIRQLAGDGVDPASIARGPEQCPPAVAHSPG